MEFNDRLLSEWQGEVLLVRLLAAVEGQKPFLKGRLKSWSRKGITFTGDAAVANDVEGMDDMGDRPPGTEIRRLGPGEILELPYEAIDEIESMV